MAVQKLAFLLLSLLTTTSMAAAREAPQELPNRSLEARLMGGGGGGILVETGDGSGMIDCWGALLELRSCTNEVVLFFLNGEAYIGNECCRAIRIITRQCWPNMLSSIGFTAEEGDILRDYCDMGTAQPSAPVATPPAPAPAPQAATV
ncbi:unnamed protein product [Spirodela intermedia]|uniref:Prolamin-like domain-containing protein n=1 Tax=Spirodela intermedia TaxID=51605 RepID=A0A7I8K2X3_SPIIN|nr:unnamed protein product [Spirodela intermedia]